MKGGVLETCHGIHSIIAFGVSAYVVKIAHDTFLYVARIG